MPTIASQTPLTTVRKPVDFGGAGGRFLISNYTAGAVVAKIYAVPLINQSSTITDHLLWIGSCAANSTTTVTDHFAISLPLRYQLEAEAASASALVLTVTSG